MTPNMRLATPQDLDTLEEIIQDAIVHMQTLGLPQWQNGYGPTRTSLAQDIQQGQLYVYADEQTIFALAALVPGVDPAYEAVEGAFHPHATSSYISIHRVVVNRKLHQKGIGKRWLRLLCDTLTRQGVRDIRIDTHRLNIAMQRVILATGFRYCGIIQFPIPDGERFVYQYFNETL